MPSDLPHPRGGKFRSKAQQRYWFATRGQAAGRQVAHNTAPAGYKGDHPVNAAHLPQHVRKRAVGNGVFIGKRYIEKSGQPQKPAQPMARNGVLVPKKQLVRSNAMGSIAAMPELIGPQQQMSKAAPGSWKTIDQRERAQVRARRQHARGILNIAGGLTVATAASSANGRSIPNAIHAGRYMAGRDRPMLLQGYQGRVNSAVRRVPWRDADEPVRAGLRRRAQYAGRIVRRSPATAVAGAGLGMIGYGATQMARGKLKEGYQQRRINSRRKANAERFGKADRFYDPEDRRQRRLGAAAAGSALVGADQVRRGVRSVQQSTRTLGAAKKVGEYLGAHDVKSKGDVKVLVNLAHNAERGAVLLNPRAAARIGGGAALVGGAGMLVRRGNDPRRRRWY